VKIDVPRQLVVAYVTGLGDDIAAALQQVGVTLVVVNADELLTVDLSKFTTVVLGPHAYQAHRALIAQNARLLEFARGGGTLVMLQDEAPRPGLRPVPYPMMLERPAPEAVAAEAAVTVVDPRSRLLRWPNVIGPDDWKGWSGSRALLVPTTVDPRYTSILEMHDPGEPANRNTILTAPIGKGGFVYTALSFQEQIPAGVPGSLRLLVNLLSAGLTAELRR
jgi:hypothetical protein